MNPVETIRAAVDNMEDQIVNEEFDNSQEIEAQENILPKNISILPLRQRPIFPGVPMPLSFTGEEFLAIFKRAVEEDQGYIGLVLTEEYDEEDYADSEFYEVGSAFQIMRILPINKESVQILGQATRRFTRKKTVIVRPNLRWEVEYHRDPKNKADTDLRAYMMSISQQIKSLLQLNPMFQEQVNLVVSQLNYDKPGMTMDVISNLLSSEKQKLQELLETFDLHERAKFLLDIISDELEVAKIQTRINKQIKDKVNDQQREFFLREQLKAIKKELGMEQDDKESEVEKLRARIAKKDLPEVARKVVEEELNKLSILNIQSPEFNVTRSYLELIADLPWNEYSQDSDSIKDARKILNRDHYGLEDVKTLILEFLSTVIKRDKISGSIICLVGPPGVGKTSIGKSIAAALNRKFFRFSVGGMRDEAEIKGHRRTYIGAMAGKLIQALKRVEVSNPVIMLDEIDKIGTGFRGDPASALLEVLDPEQNDEFLDHYLNIPYDLSNVLFITTANQLETIPRPLLDRMEIIRLSGYIKEEKVEIAKQYLVPKQLKEHGFATDEIEFKEEALEFIVDAYAREAGVRNLEKRIRKIIRKVNLKMAEEEETSFEITKADVEKMLGKPVFRTEELYNEGVSGVALGLAYTSMGGATLYIEANGIPNKNAVFKLTGQLGDVMKESAQIAYFYVRSLLAKEENDYLENHLVHLHVPAGATPKDGPSAGITMSLALYSLATQRPIKENLAMTGEITLTGKVLPIGGVKEKTIGARRVGIKELIFPIDNKRDFEELPDHLKAGITVHFADYFADVLAVAYG